MYFVWEQELEGLLGLDTCVLIYPYYNQEHHGILELICKFWYNITQIHTFSVGGRCGDHLYCGMTILSLQDDTWGYFWDLGAYFRFWYNIDTIKYPPRVGSRCSHTDRGGHSSMTLAQKGDDTGSIWSGGAS